jgi:Transglutaminase-like superfamily
MTQRSYWRLTRDVTCCISGGRVICLDTAHDRYFAPPAGTDGLLISWLDGKSSTAQVDQLLVAMAIVPSPHHPRPVPFETAVEMPLAFDAVPLPAPPVSPATLIGVASAVIKASRAVKRQPLAQTLAKAFAGMASQPVTHADVRNRRIAAFRAARPLIPVPRICLHDCLALLNWLAPHRSGVTLIFGVSAWPFNAHCWLQTDGRSIDDFPMCPSRFQPILQVS